MEDTSVSSARVFFSGSKNSNRPGIDPQRVLTVAFFTTVACAGCDSCRATGGYCFPSTASCAWLPSASLCPWPSACSPRCLRYLQPLPLLTRGQMAAKEGAAGEKFKLHIHHLTCTAPTRELVFCSYSRCLFPSVVKSQDDFLKLDVGATWSYNSDLSISVLVVVVAADRGVLPGAGDRHGNRLQSVDLQQGFMMDAVVKERGEREQRGTRMEMRVHCLRLSVQEPPACRSSILTQGCFLFNAQRS